MKILHISYRDRGGGAANLASRLHHSLRDFGVDSKMLVINKASDDCDTTVAWRGFQGAEWWLRKKASKLAESIQIDPSGAFCSSNLMAKSLIGPIRKLSPDLVHLHWVGSDTMALKDLPKIGRPLIWTLHDMWPFCGAEHIAFPLQGDRWYSGYTKESRSPAARGIDVNRITWKRKSLAWAGIGIRPVAPSEWMKACVDRSKLTQEGVFLPAAKIHHGVDRSVFYPEPNDELRAELGIAPNHKILCFGAYKSNDTVKGYQHLKNALHRLGTDFPITVITFGSGCPPTLVKADHHHLGLINEGAELRKVYSASDLLLIPSLFESFGLVAAEAMACATPVVCFGHTGLKDLVAHQTAGYCAQPFNADDFAAGIAWCLSDPIRLKRLGQSALNRVGEHFSVESMRDQYIELYQNTLSA